MIGGVGKARRVIRMLMSRYVPSALILVYHRVTELESDPQLLAVTPKNFAEHLEILRSQANPIPLKRLIETLAEGNIPNRGVVVTFDDGYSDNLKQAKPILERYGIPATVFISAGATSSKREFWWDELERLLLHTGNLPEKLTLNINGQIIRWELGEMTEYLEQDYWQHRDWNVNEKVDPTLRHSIYRSLHQRLRPLPFREQQKVLEDLSAVAGVQTIIRCEYLPLTPDEILALVQGGLIEVGAHTMTHTVLATLPHNAQQAEIEQSKSELEKIIGNPIASFAYPYGSRADYSRETVALVREAGFSCACSNFPEVIWNEADPFQLPRILIQDCDGDSFARRLRRWWDG